jgi:hypothetical protein
MDRNHVVFPTNICHPDEIVELVKGELATAIQTDMNTDNKDNAILSNGFSFQSVNRFINEFMLSTILFVTPEYGS